MLKALQGPGFGLFVVASFTVVAYIMALEIKAGENVSVRGRYGLAKRVLAWLAGILGPAGVLVVGIVLAGVMIAWAVVVGRRLVKPRSIGLRRPPIRDILSG